MTATSHSQTVVVLGASAKPQRYSYKAIRLLKQLGHRIIPVHPKLVSVEDIPVLAKLSDIDEPVDTLTMYIGDQRSRSLHDAIIALAPRRVIFNPGSESAVLEHHLHQAGIPFLHDCTLVMLQSGQFDF